MNNNSVTLIVDQHRRYTEAIQSGQKIDPIYEAKGLCRFALLLGDESQSRYVALVSNEDVEGWDAYREAGYEIMGVNGSRDDALDKLIDREKNMLRATEPDHLVVVTSDKRLKRLFDLIDDGIVKTTPHIWADSSVAPVVFKEPRYNFKPLEKILPNIKVPKVDIRLDYENLHIGLEKRGAPCDPAALIGGVKAAVADKQLGKVESITAYADWDVLSGEDDKSIQRRLAHLGIETRYQINIKGKNSADMKAADDIYALMEGKANAGYSPDVICLGTCDRDFRPLVDTARKKKKHLVILGLKGGVSQQLLQVAEVVYLDDYLSIPVQEQRNFESPVPWDGRADLVAKITIWLNERRWKWAKIDELARGLNLDREGEQLKGLIEDQVLVPYGHQNGNGKESVSGRWMLNRSHPLARTVLRLVGWAPGRLDYLLNERGMPYVDTNYLARGMKIDQEFTQLEAGRTRREAEGWLELMVRVGLLESLVQEHPKYPGKQITTWWLPKTQDDAIPGGEQVDASSTETGTSENGRIKKEEGRQTQNPTHDWESEERPIPANNRQWDPRRIAIPVSLAS